MKSWIKRSPDVAGGDMRNNAVFDYMLENEGPMTVECFVELSWFGQKTLADLEGEDLIEVEDFRDAIRELAGEQEED